MSVTYVRSFIISFSNICFYYIKLVCMCAHLQVCTQCRYPQRPKELDPCLRVFISVMKHHDQKLSWRGKGLFGLLFCSLVHHGKKPGQASNSRNLEAGTNALVMEGAAYWLLSLLSYRILGHQPRDGSTHNVCLSVCLFLKFAYKVVDENIFLISVCARVRECMYAWVVGIGRGEGLLVQACMQCVWKLKDSCGVCSSTVGFWAQGLTSCHQTSAAREFCQAVRVFYGIFTRVSFILVVITLSPILSLLSPFC